MNQTDATHDLKEKLFIFGKKKKMKNLEQTRNLYNKNYLQQKDRWSIHHMKKANRIVKIILKATKIKPKDNHLSALDVGCAKGHITEALRQNNFKAYGIDYSDVAVEKAKNNFPKCEFLHMDGFHPQFKNKFDLILVRGFSGANTHDTGQIADFTKQYLKLLNREGVYILGFRTNFRGYEKEDEKMANLTFNEIHEVDQRIRHKLKYHFYYPPKWHVKIKNIILYPFNLLGITNKKYKYFIYFVFQN